jgi:hypothetical protein
MRFSNVYVNYRECVGTKVIQFLMDVPGRYFIHICSDKREQITITLSQQPTCAVEILDHLKVVRFKVFVAVTMKNAVFWDVTPYGSCEKHTAQHIRSQHPSESCSHLST